MKPGGEREKSMSGSLSLSLFLSLSFSLSLFLSLSPNPRHIGKQSKVIGGGKKKRTNAAKSDFFPPFSPHELLSEWTSALSLSLCSLPMFFFVHSILYQQELNRATEQEEKIKTHRCGIRKQAKQRKKRNGKFYPCIRSFMDRKRKGGNWSKSLAQCI